MSESKKWAVLIVVILCGVGGALLGWWLAEYLEAFGYTQLNGALAILPMAGMIVPPLIASWIIKGINRRAIK